MADERWIRAGRTYDARLRGSTLPEIADAIGTAIGNTYHQIKAEFRDKEKPGHSPRENDLIGAVLLMWAILPEHERKRIALEGMTAIHRLSLRMPILGRAIDGAIRQSMPELFDDSREQNGENIRQKADKGKTHVDDPGGPGAKSAERTRGAREASVAPPAPRRKREAS